MLRLVSKETFVFTPASKHSSMKEPAVNEEYARVTSHEARDGSSNARKILPVLGSICWYRQFASSDTPPLLYRQRSGVRSRQFRSVEPTGLVSTLSKRVGGSVGARSPLGIPDTGIDHGQSPSGLTGRTRTWYSTPSTNPPYIVPLMPPPSIVRRSLHTPFDPRRNSSS